MELGLIVSQAGSVFGLGADYNRSGFNQFSDFFQDRQRHLFRARIERQYAIAHTTGRYETRASHRELVDKGVGVDIIEVVAGGHVGKVVSINGGDVGVFAVEVRDIRYELALL